MKIVRLFLRCNYGNYIDILSAKWGRDDNSTCGSSNGCSNMNDITSTIRFLCHGKQSCDILHVNEEKFGPVSCSGIRYLRIVHNCSDTDQCSRNPCLHGTCVTEKNRRYQCLCYPGYTGTNCQNDIDECGSNPCAHGTCINNVNSYQCICNLGYTGINCTTDIRVNECSSSPCTNGTCLDLVNGFTCLCSPGFQGSLCNQTDRHVYTHFDKGPEQKEDKETRARDYIIPVAIASGLFILLLLVFGILYFTRKSTRPKVESKMDIMADTMEYKNTPPFEHANTIYTRGF